MSLNPINKIIGENLREIREKKKKKALEMAKALDISESAYSKYERGETPINPSRAYQLADILEVSPHDILTPHEHFHVENSFHNSPINGTLSGHISNSTIVPNQILESIFDMIKQNMNVNTQLMNVALENQKMIIDIAKK